MMSSLTGVWRARAIATAAMLRLTAEGCPDDKGSVSRPGVAQRFSRRRERFFGTLPHADIIWRRPREGELRFARWRWLGGACLALALVYPAASAVAQTSQNWTWCVNKGNTFPREQAIKGCTAIIQSGTETQRNQAIAHNNRGIAYYAGDDYDHAIADFGQAIRRDPKYVDAYTGRANAYSDKGDHDRAITDYNEAIRLNPGNPIALNNRCDELLIIGQALAAIADCSESLRVRPNNVSTLKHRGNAYLAAGQADKALADYDLVLRLSANADDAWALYGRGFAKVKRGDSAGGNADIAAAKKLAPDIAKSFADKGIK